MKKVIITGGSGFLGTQIIKKLLDLGGYEIVVMDLHPSRINDEQISFFEKNLSEPFNKDDADYSLLEDPHAYIHLAGKSIFGRFTKEHKQEIWDSRVNGSRHLVEFISQERYKPERLVAASAVGWYGDQPGEVLVESSERKNYYFLSEVVEAWEDEVLRAQASGIQTTCIRNGHIIGRGGILKEVASIFKLKVGGILGNGDDYFPWIDIRDLVHLYVRALTQDTPPIINGVSTTSTTQKQFSSAIGAVKKTWFYVTVKQWMLRIVYGDFAQEMLVNQHVQSEHHKDITFLPKHTDLREVVHYYLSDNSII